MTDGEIAFVQKLQAESIAREREYLRELTRIAVNWCGHDPVRLAEALCILPMAAGQLLQRDTWPLRIILDAYHGLGLVLSPDVAPYPR